MTLNQTQRYQRIEAISATQVGQVALLLDYCVKLLGKAIQAIHENKIEDRFLNIDQAVVILMTISNNIDQASSEHAKKLASFFDKMVAGLFEVNNRNDPELCEKLQVCIQGMAGVWRDADKAPVIMPTVDSIPTSKTAPTISYSNTSQPFQLDM